MAQTLSCDSAKLRRIAKSHFESNQGLTFNLLHNDRLVYPSLRPVLQNPCILCGSFCDLASGRQSVAPRASIHNLRWLSPGRTILVVFVPSFIIMALRTIQPQRGLEVAGGLQSFSSLFANTATQMGRHETRQSSAG